MLQTELFSEGALGADRNEDRAGAGDNYIFVIDGATGLSGKNEMGSASDAAWFAGEVAALLHRGLPDGALSIGELLTDGMKALARAWNGTPEDAPSAGIAVWRLRGTDLEYFGLGDCDASLERTNGAFSTWREVRLAALDALALKQMQAVRLEKGCSMQDARRYCTDILKRHRAMRNRENGYWCLDPSGVGIPHARQAVIPAGECKSAFLCSDGFSQLIGFGAVPSLPLLHSTVKEQGAQAMYRTLYRLQEEDREMTRLPRFKLRDDASAGLMRLREED